MHVTPDERPLLAATRPYAREQATRTLFETAQTFLVLGLCLALAAAPLPWPLRLLGSVLSGLAIVRGFILYHDARHGAIFRGRSLSARLGRALLWAYGVLVLTPPTVWTESHDYHHDHTAKIVGSHIGSFPVLTVAMYRRVPPAQQRAYRVARNPLLIAFGYVTVFLWGMCLGPFLRSPKKYWDSLLALVVHGLVLAAVTRLGGLDAALFAVVLPMVITFAVGSYLFYAQHNFPDIVVQGRHEWRYTDAALHASSYLRTGPVLQWFTGNIGYHHVHHLNPGIPFYRLPEAMAGIEALQSPPTTSLHPRNVFACLRLKLWDPDAGRMVGWEAVDESAPAAP